VKLSGQPLNDAYKHRATKGFIKLAENIDVSDIINEVNNNPDLWDKHPYRRIAPNSPHKEMTDIWIRTNTLESVGKNWAEVHYPIWYEAAEKLPAIKDFCFDLMYWLKGEALGHVMITKIPSGSKIDRHKDLAWHAQFFDKFYLQLQGAEGQTFSTDDHEFTSKTGDLYWLNNQRDHWVINNSDVDRMTLIVCVKIEHD
jgi:hypothetical protein